MAASASIAALKAVLDNNIYTNSSHDITGDGLNTQLDNIIDTLDSLKGDKYAVASTQPVGGFLPNVLYNLGTLSSNTTFALASPTDNTIVNHYYWTFETSSSAPTITWPAGITSWLGGSAPAILASKHYEISVLGGVGAYMEV